jgi:hypothetical protein
MTVEVLGEGPADIETIVVGWLQPLRRTSNTRRSGDPLPMCVVECTAGTEIVEESFAEPVVSVHTLCRKSLGEDNARDEALLTHKRMLLLARYLEDYDLEYVKVFQYPRRIPYGDDQIIRYVGRYQFGQPYS